MNERDLLAPRPKGLTEEVLSDQEAPLFRLCSGSADEATEGHLSDLSLLWAARSSR